jgi:hypothetical protein
MLLVVVRHTGLLPPTAILDRCLSVPVAERDSKRIMNRSHGLSLSLTLQQLDQGAYQRRPEEQSTDQTW